jgi:hypothetical protein
MSCKDSSDSKEDAGVKTAPQKPAAPSLEELNKRCEQLGKTCGDKDNHQDKIVEQCKQAAKIQAANGCAAKAVTAYDCYEKEICTKADKVWAMDDFRVLAERHSKCVAERNASEECLGRAK